MWCHGRNIRRCRRLSGEGRNRAGCCPSQLENLSSQRWRYPPPPNPLVELVIVDQGPDAADDWIADHIQKADICVTNDIPLAARCLERGAMTIRPNGEPFTENGIGMALANRELMQGLRESGEITGGPKPFSKSDRSEFLNRLETTVQEAKRVK